MPAELKFVSASTSKEHKLTLLPGESRSFEDPNAPRRIRVTCTSEPCSLVLVSRQTRTNLDVPNDPIRRLFTLKDSRQVERWTTQEVEKVPRGDARSIHFNEGIGSFGILTIKAR